MNLGTAEDDQDKNADIAPDYVLERIKDWTLGDFFKSLREWWIIPAGECIL